MSRDKIVKRYGKKESRRPQSNEGIFEKDELLLKKLIYYHEIYVSRIYAEFKLADLKDFITYKVFLKTYVKDWKPPEQMGNSNTSIQFGDISLTIPRELYQKNLLTFVKYGHCLHYALQPETFTKHLAIDCNDKLDPYYTVPERQ